MNASAVLGPAIARALRFCSFSVSNIASLASTSFPVVSPLHSQEPSACQAGFTTSAGSDSAASTSDAQPTSSASNTHQSADSTKPDLVDRYLSPENKNKPGLRRIQKQDVIQEFQRFPGDVGSSEVQIALLTQRIRGWEGHFQVHRKDVHARRTLQIVLNQRRSMLQYLRRTNFEKYAMVLYKLGLKDIYAKQTHDDKYRVGTAHGSTSKILDRYGKKRQKAKGPRSKRK